MDDFTVKKKLYILYIFCVLLPLIITDSVVFLIIRNSEMEKQKHDMTNIANAVSYNISSVVNNAGEMAKTIYTSRYIDDFLSRKYDTSAQYIMEYQEFFKDTLLENLLGMNQIVFTMYTNNDTIVKGGKVGNIEELKETQAYQKLNQSGETKGFFFVSGKNTITRPTIGNIQIISPSILSSEDKLEAGILCSGLPCKLSFFSKSTLFIIISSLFRYFLFYILINHIAHNKNFRSITLIRLISHYPNINKPN